MTERAIGLGGNDKRGDVENESMIVSYSVTYQMNRSNGSNNAGTSINGTDLFKTQIDMMEEELRQLKETLRLKTIDEEMVIKKFNQANAELNELNEELAKSTISCNASEKSYEELVMVNARMVEALKQDEDKMKHCKNAIRQLKIDYVKEANNMISEVQNTVPKYRDMIKITANGTQDIKKFQAEKCSLEMKAIKLEEEIMNGEKQLAQVIEQASKAYNEASSIATGVKYLKNYLMQELTDLDKQ